MFQELRNKYETDPRVHLHNVGVGESSLATLTFYEHTTSSGSSSFVPVDQQASFVRRRGVNPNTIETYSVAVTSVDKFMHDEEISHVHLLKIDVQGFEPDVLAGCRQSLSTHTIDMVELEVIMTDAYKRRLSFYDIERHLVDYGYRLVALSNDGRFYNLGDFDILANRELQFDVLYASPVCFSRLTQ